MTEPPHQFDGPDKPLPKEEQAIGFGWPGDKPYDCSSFPEQLIPSEGSQRQAAWKSKEEKVRANDNGNYVYQKGETFRDQENLSAQNEGILAVVKRGNGGGWFAYGWRSFLIAAVIVLAYTLMGFAGFVTDPGYRIEYFQNMGQIATLVVGWFVISKAASGG